MFPSRMFADRFFPIRYFPPVGADFAFIDGIPGGSVLEVPGNDFITDVLEVPGISADLIVPNTDQEF